MENLWEDLRYAMRAMLKQTGFTAVTVAGTGAWHWKQCSNLQPGQWDPVAPASFPTAGPTGVDHLTAR